MNFINNNYEYKIIILGEQGVGKSRLFKCYMNINSEDNPTIGIEFSNKIIQIKDGGKVKVKIWDSSGQFRYRPIIKIHQKKVQGAFIVFDLTNQQSFLQVNEWINQIKINAENKQIIYLIGNKSDLKNLREVTRYEAEQIAKINKIKYFETSAVQNINVQECFDQLIQDVYFSVNNQIYNEIGSQNYQEFNPCNKCCQY